MLFNILRHSFLVQLSGIFIIFFLICLSFEGTFPISSQINKLAALALVLSYLSIFFWWRIKVPPEIICYGFFVLWAITTGALVSINHGLFFKGGKLVFFIWLIMFAVSGFAILKGTVTANFIGFLLLGLVVLVGGVFYGVPTQKDNTYQAISGFLDNRNTYAGYLLYSIYAIFYFFIRMKRKYYLSIFAILFLLALIYFIAQSGSRKIFIAVFLFVIVWMWYCVRPFVLKKKSALIILLVFMIGSITLPYYAYNHTYMGQRLKRTVYEDSGLSNTRNELYKESVDFFIENPVTGLGLLNFRVHSRYGVEVHSDYMQPLVTTGIPGFVLYFSCYLILWFRLSRIRRISKDKISFYDAGLYKAIVINYFWLGIGQPNYSAFPKMLLLATIIGWSFYYEKTRLQYLPELDQLHSQ